MRPALPARRRRSRLSVVVTVLGACCTLLLAGFFASTGASATPAGVVTAAHVAKHRHHHRSRNSHQPSATPTHTPAPTTAAGDPTTAPTEDPTGTTATTDPGDGDGATGQLPSTLFGGSGSPWVQQIASGASLDSDSASVVRGLSGLKFQMSHELWTVPVYTADSSSPVQDVKLTSGWQSEGTLKNVPVPAAARPDPSEDAHLAIVDSANKCEYDFWGASRDGSRLTAQVGNAIPLDSDGIYSDGNGSRGSGFSAAAGIVTADELRRGSIDHALVFAFPHTRSGGPVAPATKSDGRSSGSNTLPEGARVRLDPTIDLDKLGLNHYELIIARAMQKYGMILGDTSGGFTIYSQHPQSLPAGAYDGLLPDDTWVDLSAIPTDKLQVLKLPQQSANASGTARNRCNGF